jgi:hypothetical protein
LCFIKAYFIPFQDFFCKPLDKRFIQHSEEMIICF